MVIAKDDDPPAASPAEAYRIDKREVRRAFNAAAGSYEQNAVLQARVEDNCLERLNLIKPVPQRVLVMVLPPFHQNKYALQPLADPARRSKILRTGPKYPGRSAW